MTRHLPLVRSDCEGGPRPCPLATCEWHVVPLLVEKQGGVPQGFKGINEGDFSALTWSCLLDVIDDGPKTLNEVGEILGITRQRAQQIEDKAIGKVHRAAARSGSAAGTLSTYEVTGREAAGLGEVSEGGGGAGSPLAETTESFHLGRGSELDEDALLRERIWETYKRLTTTRRQRKDGTWEDVEPPTFNPAPTREINADESWTLKGVWATPAPTHDEDGAPLLERNVTFDAAHVPDVEPSKPEVEPVAKVDAEETTEAVWPAEEDEIMVSEKELLEALKANGGKMANAGALERATPGFSVDGETTRAVAQRVIRHLEDARKRGLVDWTKYGGIFLPGLGGQEVKREKPKRPAAKRALPKKPPLKRKTAVKPPPPKPRPPAKPATSVSGVLAALREELATLEERATRVRNAIDVLGSLS